MYIVPCINWKLVPTLRYILHLFGPSCCCACCYSHYSCLNCQLEVQGAERGSDLLSTWTLTRERRCQPSLRPLHQRVSFQHCPVFNACGHSSRRLPRSLKPCLKPFSHTGALFFFFLNMVYILSNIIYEPVYLREIDLNVNSERQQHFLLLSSRKYIVSYLKFPTFSIKTEM